VAYGSPRAERDATGGQERSVSYQPEERYWTDYLRLALPVIGLLLMLGLFLFWLNSLLDNSTGTAPTPTVIVANVPSGGDVIGAVATPTLAAGAVVTPPTVAGDAGTAPTATVGTDPGQAATDPTPTPGDDTGGVDTFAVGDQVQVSADEGLTLRSDPTTSGEALATLDLGDILTVTGPPVDGDGLSWYPVDIDDLSGFVAADFIEAA